MQAHPTHRRRPFWQIASVILVALGVACEPNGGGAKAPESEPVSEPVSQAAVPDEASRQYAWNLDEAGVAIHGVDPVSYSQEGGPVAGSPDFETRWEGGLWRFVSAENRDLFVADPARYAPANGGYCTFGVVLKKKFDGDPQVWMRRDEQTFLFLNEDVKGKFSQDLAANVDRVRENWPTIQSKSPAELE